jgi:hypothetical protein
VATFLANPPPGTARSVTLGKTLGERGQSNRGGIVDSRLAGRQRRWNILQCSAQERPFVERKRFEGYAEATAGITRASAVDDPRNDGLCVEP